MQIKSRSDLKEKRRRLRKSMTQAEHMIWARVRNNQLGNRFLRQYSIGEYIIDFYCPRLRLAIEIDGKQHTETDKKLYDQARDMYLKNLGINVLRFWNDEVLRDLDNVILKISSFPSTEGKVGKGF